MDRNNLHEYQRTTVQFILNTPKCGVFQEMGLGKTVSTLTALNTLMYEELEVKRALIIAPKRVAESVWSQECEKWDHLKHLKVSKIIGTEKQRKTALMVPADIYIIGRDNIAWLIGLYGGNMLPFDMLVIDELSSFKNNNAIRFKALRKVQPSFDRVVGLTGTPAPNGLIDLWSQLYLLDRGERLGKTITMYRNDYFTPGMQNGGVVYKYNLRRNSEEALHKRIEDICISMKASDYLQLPGRIDNMIELDFTEELKARYKDFEKSQVLKLFDKDEDISAINAAALSNKLLQFANGAVYDEDKTFHEFHEVKLNAAEELVESANGQPVLIAWTYRSDMIRLMKKLSKYKPRELKEDKDIQDWNRGDIQVLLMHPASGGHGLNLQKGGNIIIWFGQTWSLELYQQLNARLDRQGQSKPVIINHLIMRGTLDEDVIKAQKSKSEVQNSLMEAIKARINNYIR